MALPPFDDQISVPGDTDFASVYPAQERANRDTVASRYDIEHDKVTGRHRFGVGTLAARDGITTWVDGAVWIVEDPTIFAGARAIMVYDEAGTSWEVLGIDNGQHVNDWTAGQFATPVVLVDAAVVASDWAASNYFSLAPTQNFTLGNPTNKPAGGKVGSWAYYITQDIVGSRTIAFDTDYSFPFGIAPELTETPSATDILYCTLRPDGKISVAIASDDK